MKKNVVFIAGISVLMFLSASCKKDNNVDTGSKTQTQIVNEWIYDGMRSVYFWNNSIPAGLDPLTESDSKAFFDKMLYKPKDKWSYITDNYTALEAELQGEPLSMGYAPGFIQIGSSNNIAIFVEYVYPGSPADVAGLKRGDLIVNIDGQDLNISNYYDLYSKESYTAGLGDFSSGTLASNGKTVNLTSEVITADPVLYHDVIDVNGVKTGYLVFTEFTPGVGNKYLTELGNVFDDFKTRESMMLL